jgi:hypothetical protein
MPEVAYHPVTLFVVSIVALVAAAAIGSLAHRKYPLDEEMHTDFNVLLGSALTLLALIISFSFSMASSRYDQRKNLEEAEANAIGTEYSRAQLLPAADAAKIQVLLKSYIDLRIQYFTEIEAGVRRDNAARTGKLQDELWAAVLPTAAAAPNPIVALVVSGMNDVLNSQSYTQAAFRNRIPVSAWNLIGIIAICCNFMVGYGVKSRTSARRLLFVFPLFISIAVMFIADIDAPRRGIIKVVPQNLISLAQSLRT